MRIFPLTADLLNAKYHGSGYALVAIHGATVVDLVYLEDALPEWEPAADAAGIDLQAAIVNDRLRPVIEQLRAQGEVSVGKLSCSEFCEL